MGRGANRESRGRERQRGREKKLAMSLWRDGGWERGIEEPRRAREHEDER